MLRRSVTARLTVSTGIAISVALSLPTRTSAQAATATPTATPGIARIAVRTVIGRPGDTVELPVSLISAGNTIAGTANDITFDKTVLSIDPTSCSVNPATGKFLLATLLSDFRNTRTLRFFVQSTADTNPIPDGTLYTCLVVIGTSTLPGTYTLTIKNTQAFDPDGDKVIRLTGSGGAVVVSLVVPDTATPTATATGTGTATVTATPSVTATPTSTPSPTATPGCPHSLALMPAAGLAGVRVALSGRCNLVQAGGHATVYFDDVPKTVVNGDANGAYAGMLTVPHDAANGSHVIRVVAGREIAAADFDVLGPAPCVGDCNSDGTVTIDEVLLGEAVVRGDAQAAACVSLDADNDGSIGVDELLVALTHVLDGCAP